MREADRRQEERGRRIGIVLLIMLIIIGFTAYANWSTSRQNKPQTQPTVTVPAGQELATKALGKLAVRESVSSEGYSRDQFGSGWSSVDGCDTRNRILRRDVEPEVIDPNDGCTVLSGTLKDPYTGKTISFARGPGTSDDVQIDHVVALSDAWQKGAQNLTPEKREAFANDPLNLLAVDGPTNMEKSDSDAAEWLPPQASYRCRYVARQVAVKLKYMLWITPAERNAMDQTLQTCPAQILPIEGSS